MVDLFFRTIIGKKFSSPDFCFQWCVSPILSHASLRAEPQVLDRSCGMAPIARPTAFGRNSFCPCYCHHSLRHWYDSSWLLVYCPLNHCSLLEIANLSALISQWTLENAFVTWWSPWNRRRHPFEATDVWTNYHWAHIEQEKYVGPPYCHFDKTNAFSNRFSFFCSEWT